MFMMVDYVREMIVKKSCMSDMDCLSILLFLRFLGLVWFGFFSLFLKIGLVCCGFFCHFKAFTTCFVSTA